MPKTNLLDIVDVLETYADLYDIFDDNKFVRKELDKVYEELRAIPYVKAIPIEWILKWACEFIDPNSEGYKMAMELVHDWRKENEQAN